MNHLLLSSSRRKLSAQLSSHNIVTYFPSNTTTSIIRLPSRFHHHSNSSTPPDDTINATMTPVNQHQLYYNENIQISIDGSESSSTIDEESTENSSVCSSASSKYDDLVVSPHVGHKKVLVTGGAGFVGSSVAEALLARGDDVVIVDEMNDYYDVTMKESNLKRLGEMYPGEGRLVVYRGNICDMTLMRAIFESERPEWVCHMAARAGVRPSIDDPFVYIQSNIVGTTLLMELSAKYGIRNFVFASSSSVYGGSKSTYFSEDENVDNPVSPYAATKKACELLAYTYHHLYKLNVSALRFFTVYGPRGRPDMAPFQFVDKISRGVEIQKFGDGSSSRDYTYISDIVAGVVRSIDRAYPYQVFNLGKGDGTSLNEFIGIVEKHTGMTAKVKQLPDQAGDVPYTCASVEKARALLGYEATVSFDEGIRRTVEWYNSRGGTIVKRTDVLIAGSTTLVDSLASKMTQISSLELTRRTPVEQTMSSKSGISRVVSVDVMSQHRVTKRKKPC